MLSVAEQTTQDEVIRCLQDIVDIYNLLHRRSLEISSSSMPYSHVICRNYSDTDDVNFIRNLLDSCGINYYTEFNSDYFPTSKFKQEALQKLSEFRDEYNQNAPEAAEEIIERQDLLNPVLQEQMLIASIWIKMQGEDKWEHFLPQTKKDAESFMESIQSLICTQDLFSLEAFEKYLEYKIEQLKQSDGVTELKDLSHTDQQIIRALKTGIKQIATDLGLGEGIEVGG